MATELTPEEEAKAKELEQKSKEEKTTIEQMADDVSALTDMAKSQTESGKEPLESKEPKLDMDLNAEDMAKSIAKAEKPGEFIKELMDHCNVGIGDLRDENNEQYFPEEMLKSLQDSEEETNKMLWGILQTNKAQGERYAKAIETMMNMELVMTKSFGGVLTELGEMKKSFAKPAEVKEEGDGEQKSPDVLAVGGDASADPKSKDGAGGSMMKSTHTVEEVTDVLKKSFENMGNEAKYFSYKKILDKFGTDFLFEKLETSKDPSERNDFQTITNYLG